MSPILIGVIGIGFLLVFMFLGVPIGFCMATVGFCGYILIGGMDEATTMIRLVPYSSIASYIFSVMPVYLLMSEFTSASGLMGNAYLAAYKWLSRLPGGLAMASIVGCAGFAAVCGSSAACAATMTRVALPDMREYNYDPKLAIGTLGAGGTLGILIPPSLGFIIYGMIAEQSIGQLYMAGIIPGIVLSLLFMVTIYIICRRNPQMGPPGPKVSWRERFVSLKNIWGVALLFLLVMGGIWGGIFTPTEAGAVGTVVAFLILLGRKRLTRQVIVNSFTNTTLTVGMIIIILVGAMIFTYFMARAGVPTALANFVSSLQISRIGVIVCILIVYIILGALMDPLGMALLTVPVFLPLVLALDFDPIWFGVILTIMTELGLLTPPIGMNVFIMAGMAKDIPIYDIFRGVVPFCIVMLVMVAILIVFPQIALFLPNTMMAG